MLRHTLTYQCAGGVLLFLYYFAKGAKFLNDFAWEDNYLFDLIIYILIFLLG